MILNFGKTQELISNKKKLTEEVMTYAFKNCNNYHEICRYFATTFKEHYNTEKWTFSKTLLLGLIIEIKK